ncbi:low affinity iron permease family protein [Bradyrhizobium sp. CIR18]|uniref:low affinity iron permease family protein n=1 Tax=Bradyrhizobium sp. CIR18 TaxID=2663839 RepID=UPI002110D9BC|nr:MULTISPECIES: low affinity iron permease family protein [unclassified Bradyrhizobium]
MATLSTWGMTLVIQRAEHRDTQALHAKLDELLRVNGDAKNSLMTLDNKDAEEVEEERAAQFRWDEPKGRNSAASGTRPVILRVRPFSLMPISNRVRTAVVANLLAPDSNHRPSSS